MKVDIEREDEGRWINGEDIPELKEVFVVTA